MVPISLTYRGDLRCEAVHGPSKVALTTDAPVDNNGRGESFSPTDLVATALGACLTTVMGIVAKRDGVGLDGLSVSIEKHMTAQPPRRIARIVVAVSMPKGLAADYRAKLERAAHTCPVALSLHPDVVQEIRFTYAD